MKKRVLFLLVFTVGTASAMKVKETKLKINLEKSIPGFVEVYEVPKPPTEILSLMKYYTEKNNLFSVYNSKSLIDEYVENDNIKFKMFDPKIFLCLEQLEGLISEKNITNSIPLNIIEAFIKSLSKNKPENLISKKLQSKQNKLKKKQLELTELNKNRKFKLEQKDFSYISDFCDVFDSAEIIKKVKTFETDRNNDLTIYLKKVEEKKDLIMWHFKQKKRDHDKKKIL